MLKIRRAGPGDIPAAHGLHASQAGEFIWPRSLEDFAALVDDRAVFLVEDASHRDVSQGVVGVCYVRPDINAGVRRWEFGGVFVEPSLRGLGLASTLGAVAIATAVMADEVILFEGLIAHVHEDNPAPRGLLVHRLGFVQAGQEEAPAELAPPSMRRNNNGKIVGDVFTFNRTQLAKFATELQPVAANSDRTISIVRNDTITKLAVEVKILADPDTCSALRELGVVQ